MFQGIMSKSYSSSQTGELIRPSFMRQPFVIAISRYATCAPSCFHSTRACRMRL